jgi:replication factor A1
MSIDLIDREGTLIQGTMFNETAEKWYPKIEENKVYVFANGKVGLSNKRFTSIKNDYSLTFGMETEIQECGNDQNIQTNGFCFTKIDLIKDQFANTTIDVIGVVMEVQPISSIQIKTGGSKERQGITIADETGASITVTVWGDYCRTLAA